METMSYREPKAVIALLAVVLSTLAISGCGGNDQAAAGDSGTAVTSVVLRNGVRCAVMDGTTGKALDCDWAFGSREKPTGIDPKGDRGTAITLIGLADGTPCAVMDGGGRRGSALSCGWRPS
jgi:hypothetical protein